MRHTMRRSYDGGDSGTGGWTLNTVVANGLVIGAIYGLVALGLTLVSARPFLVAFPPAAGAPPLRGQARRPLAPLAHGFRGGPPRRGHLDRGRSAGRPGRHPRRSARRLRHLLHDAPRHPGLRRRAAGRAHQRVRRPRRRPRPRSRRSGPHPADDPAGPPRSCARRAGRRVPPPPPGHRAENSMTATATPTTTPAAPDVDADIAIEVRADRPVRRSLRR